MVGRCVKGEETGLIVTLAVRIGPVTPRPDTNTGYVLFLSMATSHTVGGLGMWEWVTGPLVIMAGSSEVR